MESARSGGLPSTSRTSFAGGRARKNFGVAIGPAHGDFRDNALVAQAEVQARIVVRNVARLAQHEAICLPFAASIMTAAPIALRFGLGSAQLDLHPVVRACADSLRNSDGASPIFNHEDVHVRRSLSKSPKAAPRLDFRALQPPGRTARSYLQKCLFPNCDRRAAGCDMFRRRRDGRARDTRARSPGRYLSSHRYPDPRGPIPHPTY